MTAFPEHIEIDHAIESLWFEIYQVSSDVLQDGALQVDSSDQLESAMQGMAVGLTYSCMACTNMVYSLEVIKFPFRAIASVGPFRQCVEAVATLLYLIRHASPKQWDRYLRDKKALPGLKEKLITLSMLDWYNKYGMVSGPLHSSVGISRFALQEDLASHMFFDMAYLVCVAIHEYDEKYSGGAHQERILSCRVRVVSEVEARWPSAPTTAEREGIA